ncbi:uncharacterized protein LACBIDRAFT_309858 [Laccaria bicolor S238N-H82]|uniref:Predicted protein n=1 Tax=Laccaria bicolor (strain S238N-H82 / ATCC MYA-4686) TaxID=486041 RepID=B0DT74_LACBS|nr:uncharacterized protein LACBIDRAFT_309858 [Laccaria bicolor S238N-H82]EDR02170.1 predicted protein [Laccaria bicolor S238N-H82]|eukprot:XP_001887115.1 predicted protein [Laccaria bicolor S238N-H82]
MSSSPPPSPQEFYGPYPSRYTIYTGPFPNAMDEMMYIMFILQQLRFICLRFLTRDERGELGDEHQAAARFVRSVVTGFPVSFEDIPGSIRRIARSAGEYDTLYQPLPFVFGYNLQPQFQRAFAPPQPATAVQVDSLLNQNSAPSATGSANAPQVGAVPNLHQFFGTTSQLADNASHVLAAQTSHVVSDDLQATANAFQAAFDTSHTQVTSNTPQVAVNDSQIVEDASQVAATAPQVTDNVSRAAHFRQVLIKAREALANTGRRVIHPIPVIPKASQVVPNAPTTSSSPVAAHLPSHSRPLPPIPSPSVSQQTSSTPADKTKAVNPTALTVSSSAPAPVPRGDSEGKTKAAVTRTVVPLPSPRPGPRRCPSSITIQCHTRISGNGEVIREVVVTSNALANHLKRRREESEQALEEEEGKRHCGLGRGKPLQREGAFIDREGPQDDDDITPASSWNLPANDTTLSDVLPVNQEEQPVPDQDMGSEELEVPPSEPPQVDLVEQEIARLDEEDRLYHISNPFNQGISENNAAETSPSPRQNTPKEGSIVFPWDDPNRVSKSVLLKRGRQRAIRPRVGLPYKPPMNAFGQPRHLAGSTYHNYTPMTPMQRHGHLLDQERRLFDLWIARHQAKVPPRGRNNRRAAYTDLPPPLVNGDASYAKLFQVQYSHLFTEPSEEPPRNTWAPEVFEYYPTKLRDCLTAEEHSTASSTLDTSAIPPALPNNGETSSGARRMGTPLRRQYAFEWESHPKSGDPVVTSTQRDWEDQVHINTRVENARSNSSMEEKEQTAASTTSDTSTITQALPNNGEPSSRMQRMGTPLRRQYAFEWESHPENDGLVVISTQRDWEDQVLINTRVENARRDSLVEEKEQCAASPTSDTSTIPPAMPNNGQPSSGALRRGTPLRRQYAFEWENHPESGDPVVIPTQRDWEDQVHINTRVENARNAPHVSRTRELVNQIRASSAGPSASRSTMSPPPSTTVSASVGEGSIVSRLPSPSAPEAQLQVEAMDEDDDDMYATQEETDAHYARLARLEASRSTPSPTSSTSTIVEEEDSAATAANSSFPAFNPGNVPAAIVAGILSSTPSSSSLPSPSPSPSPPPSLRPTRQSSPSNSSTSSFSSEGSRGTKRSRSDDEEESADDTEEERATRRPRRALEESTPAKPSRLYGRLSGVKAVADSVRRAFKKKKN